METTRTELVFATNNRHKLEEALITGDCERIFTGSVEGSISTERHGDGGFGYDPVFVADESGKAFAEMTPEAKNSISHRGRAIRAMEEALRSS